MQRKLRDGEEREHKSEREEEGEEADGIEDEFGVSFATVEQLDKACVDVRWAKVKAAEIQENPLEALPSFTVFNKNGVKFNLETKKY